MKRLFVTILSAAMLAAQLCFGDNGKRGFVKADPAGFSVNGKPYSFVGVNLWYGAILASDGEGGDRNRLEAELDILKANGIDNLRILVGGDGDNGIPSRIRPTLQKKPGVYNDTILKGLDRLLVMMGERDMKAVLYLNNSWEWSGGYAQYLEWAGKGTAPDPAADGYQPFCDFVSQFARCRKARKLFLNHIDNIVTRTNSVSGLRYADDPVIMAWEIGNEPRAFGDEGNKAPFAAWMSEASARIRKHDKNHLITTGSEGMCGCEGDYNLFETIHSDPNIDYMTIHIWPKNWGWIGNCPDEENLVRAITNTRGYIASHAGIARRHRKPMVLEEFGFPRDSMNFATGTPTTLRDRYFEAVFSMIDEGDIAGCNLWAWGGLAKPAEGHTFWQPGDDYTGDPAQEEQGLNSIFASDTTTLRIIRNFSPLTRGAASQLAAVMRATAASGRYIFGHADDTVYGHGWAWDNGRSDVMEVCGDYPGIINWDLGMIELLSGENLDGVPFDRMRDEVKAQARRGGINTLSWHPRNPHTGGDAWDTGGKSVSLGVIPGTALNDTLRIWITRAAEFISSLRDDEGNRIPVVFRPWHEHTGSWFWWGESLCQADEYKRLWHMTREIFDNLGVDNVLWAYSPDAVETSERYMERYPGDGYVDIMGADVYHHGGAEGAEAFRSRVRATLSAAVANAKTRGKIAALTETGSESLPMDGWWTDVLAPLCAEFPVSYVCVWRNAHDRPTHFFGPWKGHPSADSFRKFHNDRATVFAKELRDTGNH